MSPEPQHRQPLVTRRSAVLALLGAVGGCGGSESGSAQAPIEGSRETRTIGSRINGAEYALSIYLPPASAGPRDRLPIVYMLDGESWFETLVGIVESSRSRLIIVGISSAGRRSTDFVPLNSCTSNGGGHAAYFDFVRHELLPFVEATIGGDPRQRALFGHSHGGSLVLYAMFAQAPDQHSFKAYLSSDASVSCMPSVAYGWEESYAAAHTRLPVRLHISCATQGNYAANMGYAGVIAQRSYTGLALASQAYGGTHGGIVPEALAAAVAFAFAGGA